MEKLLQIAILVTFCLCVSSAANFHSNTQEVKFQALKSGGFRGYIEDTPGTTKFKLVIKINGAKMTAGDTNSASNGFWVVDFVDPVKVGDTISYTSYVDYGRLRYPMGGEIWQVADSDMFDVYPLLGVCQLSSTIINGQRGCVGKLIISEQFEELVVNRNKWIVEHRIPTYRGVNAEFSSYEDTDATRFIKDGVLYLRPVARRRDHEVRGTLNLMDGCTSTDRNQCYYQQRGVFVLPPVKSARISSAVSFKYGKVEIKAKLPAGEWIVPVIQLESKDNNNVDFSPKILIAYSRGNDHLIAPGGVDIGSHVLYAGPVYSPGMLDANQKLIKRANSSQRYCDDFHVYTLDWSPGTLSFYVDSELIGTANTEHEVVSFDKELILSLGVAVGGLDDFPDNCFSGINPRPWDYNDRSYLKNFFEARDVWLRTWVDNDCALQIKHVKVWAI